MTIAEHKWIDPPAGQSGLKLCANCGARKRPDIADPDHPQHGCSSKPQDHQSFHEREYEPI
jgi:hypothetical protein